MSARLLELVKVVYSTVDDPERWGVLLDAILEDTTFQAAAVGYQADSSDPMMTGVLRGVTDAQTERLYAEVLPDNPLMASGKKLTPGPHALMDEHIIPRHLFKKSSYYKWLVDIGADRILVAVSLTSPRSVVHMPRYVRPGAEVTRDHLDEARALLPHVAQALAISRKIEALERTCRSSLDAMDRAHFGCVLIGHDRRIEWMNDYAEAILERGDALRVEDHRLVAAHPLEQAPLERDVDVALGLSRSVLEPPRPTHRVRKDGDSGYIELLVSPLSPFGHPILDRRTGALVMLADPDYLDEDIASRLESLYDLTPAEAEATQWLLSGYSIDAIAEVFGRSQHTVRNHIKRVLKKCGVSSQAQLVGLIHRGVACLS